MSSNSYRLVTGVSVCGLALVVVIQALNNGSGMSIWTEKQQLDKDAERQKAKVEYETKIHDIQATAQAEKAQIYRDNGIADSDKLILVTYTACKIPPQRDWARIVNPTHPVKVYDKFRVLIGVASKGKFTPKRFSNECTGSN